MTFPDSFISHGGREMIRLVKWPSDWAVAVLLAFFALLVWGTSQKADK